MLNSSARNEAHSPDRPLTAVTRSAAMLSLMWTTRNSRPSTLPAPACSVTLTDASSAGSISRPEASKKLMLTAAASTTRLGVTACAAEMTASLAAASTVMVVPSGKTPSAAETETETPLPAVPPAVKAGIAGAAGVSVEVGASSVLSLPEIGSCFAGASVGAGSSSFSAEAVGASVAAGVSVAAGASSRFSSSEDDTASCVFSVSAITVPGASFAVSSADGAPSVFAAPAASAVFSAPAGFASAEPSVSSVSSCALSAIAFSALGASSLAAAAVTAFPKTMIMASSRDKLRTIQVLFMQSPSLFTKVRLL